MGGHNAVTGFSGARLRAARRRAGLTQQQLAEALGVPYQHVQRWESPHGSAPRSPMLRRIAEALTLAPHELLDDTATGLSHLRNTAGLSQSELAAAAGIARSTYSAIERGAIATLDPHTAEKIATALHVTPTAVLDAHANTDT